MARQESVYPGSLDTFDNAATDFNPGDAVPSTDFERLIDAIKTVQTELGTDPAGSLTDVKTRLAVSLNNNGTFKDPISLDGAVTINNSEADKDFRVAAVGATNALFVQGSNGFVGIGKNNPATELDIVGNVTIEAAKLTVGATTPTATQWGYLGGSSGIDHLVYRGDPATVDFVVGDLTTDGTWRGVDFSSIVPAGTTAVLLAITVADDAAANVFQMKKYGQTNDRNRSRVYTQIASVAIVNDWTVFLDGDRKALYWATNTTWNTINIVVKGWWIA